MFSSLFGMLDNYEDRKVGNYEVGDVFVSTCYVTDTNHPYETAVSHPLYNDNKLIIVEEYDALAEAKAGHRKWVSKMTASTLPASLTDVSSSVFKLLAVVIGDDSSIRMRQDFLDVGDENG